jgi:murein DD-endopeptidase MepM/ murein hydrolase activator NlpD
MARKTIRTERISLFFACLAGFLGLAGHLAAASIDVLPKKIIQGSTLTLVFHSEQALSPTASGLQQEAAFYLSSDDPHKYYALIAVPLKLDPDDYPLRVAWVDAGQAFVRKFVLSVAKRPGKLRTVHLPPKADKAVDSLNDEKPLLSSALKSASGPPFWRGSFLQPVSGPVSTGYGAPRLYLPGGYRWRHQGIDFAVAEGSAVLAANDGVVELARPDMQAYGGLVVLSHGYGLTSTYMHLSRILVAQGQRVIKGQPIALSGNSGISTGAHLHWQMDLNGFSVDPKPWIGGVLAKN